MHHIERRVPYCLRAGSFNNNGIKVGPRRVIKRNSSLTINNEIARISSARTHKLPRITIIQGGALMNPADQFRRRAQDCKMMAAVFPDRDTRAVWNHLAERWLHFALEEEKRTQPPSTRTEISYRSEIMTENPTFALNARVALAGPLHARRAHEARRSRHRTLSACLPLSARAAG